MKHSKKIVWAYAMAGLLSIAGLTGCDGGGNGGDSGGGQAEDPTKTNLYVKYFNGGLDREWIDHVCDDFMTAFKDYSFEEGKKGVNIVKEFEKNNINVNSVQSSKNAVFFNEDTDYYDFVSRGVCYDMTDMVQQGAITGVDASGSSFSREEKTIESKMDATRQGFYNVKDSEGKDHYYALPFYESTCNLVYNVDLFEQYGFYFAQGKTAEGMSNADLHDASKVEELFVEDGKNSPRSYGPNGKTGTVDGVDYSYDDGLPATYADFQALITYMEYAGVYPFVWNGIEQGYLTSLILGDWMSEEGMDQAMKNLTWTGDLTHVMDVASNGQPQFNDDGSLKMKEGNTTIDAKNAYLLHAQKGAYESMRFAKMIGDSKYYNKSNSSSFTHINCQTYFMNGYAKGYCDKPIAMMVEGTWWNNEGKANYGDAADKMSRRYAILPYPKSDASKIGEPNVMLSDRSSVIFINKWVSKELAPCAEAFVSFFQNETSMNTFTQYTDMLRALDYEVTPETQAKMDYYGKNVIRMSNYDDAQVIDWLPQSSLTRKNYAMTTYRKWGYSFSSSDDDPIRYFTDNDDASAEEYFAKIYNYYKNGWGTMVKA